MPEKAFMGKVALITGGHSGIGEAIAKKFAFMGADIAMIGMSVEKGMHATKQVIEQYQVKAVDYRCNVAKEEEVRNTVAQIVEEFGKIDFLINNAGIYPAVPFLEMDSELFCKIFDINVKGIFHMTKEVVNQSMKAQRAGKVISISSVDSWKPTKGITAYAASKAAVNSLVKSFALELAEYGITSNGVAPGWVATEAVLKAGRFKSQIQDVLKRRMAEPCEIGEIVTFLCEERADYINGEILNLSGGLLMNG
ncbi:SDR family oxidoreductase [Lachnospiraceae bacterium ZAX-1]